MPINHHHYQFSHLLNLSPNKRQQSNAIYCKPFFIIHVSSLTFVTYQTYQFHINIPIKQKMHRHMKDSSRLWDYEVLGQLGRGEYGQVFKVKNKKNGLIYALKKVNIAACHEKQKIQAFRQIKALKLIQHPDIIEYYESFLSMDNIYIVMEYAAKGDFSKIIKQRKAKEKLFTEQQLWNIYTVLTNALKYLHQKGIIHRDLKLENIFMTEDGKVKIGDLGMCKVIQDPNELISTRVGTPAYFAPQIIQHQLYSYPVDVWALGCIFYYLATLEHPFKEATIQTLAYFVIEKDPRPIKGHYGAYLINLINQMLTKNVKKRPNIFDVNLNLKNKDNPDPQTKVRVFDFKKLLMMKQDLQKLDQMKKTYQRQKSFGSQESFRETAPSPTCRQQNSSEIKTYREFIKLNLSPRKQTLKQEQNPQLSMYRNHKNQTSKTKLKSPNLSVVIPQTKVLIDSKQLQPFSPIKTNGFDCKSAALRNSNDLTSSKNIAQVVRVNRNYSIIRHNRKSVII